MNEVFNVSQQEIINLFCIWLKRQGINPEQVDIISIIKFNRTQFLIDCFKSSSIIYPHVYDYTLLDKQLLTLFQFAECNYIKYTRCWGTVNPLYLYLENSLKLSEALQIEA